MSLTFEVSYSDYVPLHIFVREHADEGEFIGELIDALARNELTEHFEDSEEVAINLAVENVQHGWWREEIEAEDCWSVIGAYPVTYIEAL